MGNILAALQMTNNSKRTARIYITEKEEQLDAFVTSQPHPAGVVPPGSKIFLKGVKFVRVLASNTEDVPMEMKRYVSIFMEDDGDQNICSKQITLNMAVTFPMTVLLYDV